MIELHNINNNTNNNDNNDNNDTFSQVFRYLIWIIMGCVIIVILLSLYCEITPSCNFENRNKTIYYK